MIRTCTQAYLYLSIVVNHTRGLKNGVPEESIMAPLLFNICISDLPNTVSRQYAHADDLAIMHADGDWQTVEGVLSKQRHGNRK